MITGLIFILLLVLLLPFTKLVERNLEVFLFIMGVASIIVSQSFSMELLKKALTYPINITITVVVAGLVFRWFQTSIENLVLGVNNAIPFRLFIALFIIILGLISSIITAIIAAIILASVVRVLEMERKAEIRLVVIACFAIGLGATLTPIGEPLSTIVTSNLNEDFFYLLRLLGIYIVPGIISFGIFASFMINSKNNIKVIKFGSNLETRVSERESYTEIVARSLKIYLFVMALSFLGTGFQPFIEYFILNLNPLKLYWINMMSAILDNATLAAAEISPAMTEITIRNILLGLIISGGMLIPGNIPNIIITSKLKITSMEYAKFAIPVGLVTMAIYFIVILFVR